MSLMSLSVGCSKPGVKKKSQKKTNTNQTPQKETVAKSTKDQEKVFADFTSAMNEKNWKKAYSHLTKSSQDVLLGTLMIGAHRIASEDDAKMTSLVSILMLEEFKAPPLTDENGKPLQPDPSTGTITTTTDKDAVVESHQSLIETLEGMKNPLHMKPKDMILLAKQLAGKIAQEHKPVCFSKMMEWLAANEPASEHRKIRFLRTDRMSDAKLTNLFVDKSLTRGDVVFKENPKDEESRELRESIVFRMGTFEQGWLIDLLASSGVK